MRRAAALPKLFRAVTRGGGICSVLATQAFSQTWVGLAGGQWGTAANWSPASVPNAIDATANWTNGVQPYLTVGGPFTIGTLNFFYNGGTQAFGSNSGTDLLTLQSSVGMPTIYVTNNGAAYFYVILYGTQGFNKTGPGTLTFRYNNFSEPYTGSVVVSGGALGLNIDGNLGNANNGIVISNNAQILFNPTTAASATLAASRSITLACPSANIAVANTSYSLTIAGNIGESVVGSGLQKSDVGTLALSGANTYSGSTKISGGALSVAANNNLGSAAASILFDGGVLQITGTAMTNFGRSVSFISGKSVTLDVNDINNRFTTDQSLTQGTGGLIKIGPGTLQLGQPSTYTGSTTVNAGCLALLPGASLAASSAINLGDGATFDVSSVTNFSFGGASLTASATGATTYINGNPVGVVSLGTQPVNLNYNCLTPALIVKQGALSLSGQMMTITTTQALGNGVYNLIQVNSGNLIHSGTYVAAGNATNGAAGHVIGFTTNAGVAYVTLTITGSTNPAAWLGGPGLRADFFKSIYFTNQVATQAVANVNFNWGNSPPVSGLGTNYSVRFSGRVVPAYSDTYTFHVTARSGARLWVNNRLLTARTLTMSGAETVIGSIALTGGKACNLMLEYVCQGATNASLQLAWSSPTQPWQVIPQNQLSALPLDTSDEGTILEEYWTALTGTNIATLTGNTNFPNQPAGRELLQNFESLAPNWTTNLGTRVSGWLTPLTNGDYQFAVAAADTAQLSLSTDSTTNNKIVIATVSSASGFRQFGTFPSQQSVSIPLIGGQEYFIELLQKASTNSSYFSVAWKPPDASGFSVIPGEFLAPNGLHTPQPTAGSIFSTLATAHPRLMTSPERFVWLKQCIASNAPAYVIAAWQSVSNAAAGELTSPVQAFNSSATAGNGQTIWAVVQNCGLTYFVTGNTNFAERAWLEMSNACTFPAWWANSNDGLGQGEMTLGMGLGYDWFYNYLTPARRSVITNAMLTLGANPSQGQYPYSWYVQNTANNWAMVFNSGSAALAIALANDFPSESQSLLSSAIDSIRPVMGHFTLDNGGYYEGSEYWDYGVGHLNMMMASIESSLGTLFSLDDTPGYDDTALFEVFNTGPMKQGFNYSDSYSGNIAGSGLTWLSRRYNRPAAAWWKHLISSPGGAQEILWYDGRDTNDMRQLGYSPNNYFRGPTATTSPVFDTADVSIMRTKWSDTNSSFVGFKNGALDNPHGHLDAGSFVFDALGRRWFSDLGTGNYSDTNYFDSVGRWWIYCCRAEGHNTLLLNSQLNTNADQVTSATPSVIFSSAESGGDQAATIADLTPAYKFSAQSPSRVWRGLKLFNNRAWLMVQDEVVAATGQNLWWFSHFNASGVTWGLSADGSSVTFTNGGNRLWVKLLTGGASFSVSNAVPLPTSPNPSQAGVLDNWSGYRKLALNFTGVTNTTLTVLAVPLLAGDSPPQRLPAVVPLAGWATNDLDLRTNSPPVASSGSATFTNNLILFNYDLRPLVADAITPSNLLVFSISQVSTGSVALLADGHTAQFSVPPNFAGAATLSYSVNDQWPDSRLLFYFDLQSSNWTNLALPNDVSGRYHDGTFDTSGGGSYGVTNLVPTGLSPFLSQSARLSGGIAAGARMTRGITTAEWNLSQTNWTFSGWFRSESLAANNCIFYAGNGSGIGGAGDELIIYCDTTHNLVVKHWNSSSANDFTLTASGVVNTGVWNQVALVFDTTNGTSGTVRLYLNGALAASQSNVVWKLNQSAPLRFGAHAQPPSGSMAWFNGELTEIALFKTALTQPQITSLTNRTVAYIGGGVASNTVIFNILAPPPPVLAAQTNRSLVAGQTLLVTNIASDSTTPPQRLLFSLLTAPSGASINATSGVISWRPTVAQGGTSNLFAVLVTQNGWLTNIPPLAAAYVRDGAYSNVNFGTSTTLAVKYFSSANSGNSRESYLQFSVADISGWPASAVLQLMPLSASFAGTHAVALATNDGWLQNAITWSNKPASGAPLATWTPSGGTLAQVDVTSAAISQIAGDGVLSLRLFGTNQTADGLVTYGSIGGAATNVPALVVISTNNFSLSATQSFWVRVISPAVPTLLSPTLAGGQISFSVTGSAGPDYIFLSSTNLASTNWLPVQTNFSATPPSGFTDWITNAASKFYRIQLGP